MDLPSFKTLELPKLTYRLSCTQHFGRRICVRHVSPWYRTWILLGHAGKKIYVGDMARTRPWTRQKEKKKGFGWKREKEEYLPLASVVLTLLLFFFSPASCSLSLPLCVFDRHLCFESFDSLYLFIFVIVVASCLPLTSSSSSFLFIYLKFYFY